MSHIDPVQAVANVATGGLYGAGKAGVDVASGKQDVLGGARAGFNQLGPYGSAVYPVSPRAAEAGNLAGAGAGVGAGLAGGFQGGGTGAATPATLDPVYFGYSPDTLASLGTSEFGQFATGIPTAGMIGAPAAGLAAGSMASGSGTGAMIGAAGGQQAAGLLGGAAPFLAMPQGGAVPAGSPGGLTPAQLAALSAQQSEAHRGLAPRFEERQQGTRESPGIASMSQYYSAGGR